MNNEHKILIPIIRNIDSITLALDIVSVQPMMVEDEDIKIEQKLDIHVCEDGCEDGVWIHSFLYGYQKVIECPLYHNKYNVNLCQVRSNGSIFSMKSLPIASQLMFTQIHNMRYS